MKKTTFFVEMIILVLFGIMIIGCKEDTPEPEYVTKVIKYQVTKNTNNNDKRNFHIQYNDSNTEMITLESVVPWEKTFSVNLKKGATYNTFLFASCTGNAKENLIFIAKISVNGIEVKSEMSTNNSGNFVVRASLPVR